MLLVSFSDVKHIGRAACVATPCISTTDRPHCSALLADNVLDFVAVGLIPRPLEFFIVTHRKVGGPGICLHMT